MDSFRCIYPHLVKLTHELTMHQVCQTLLFFSVRDRGDGRLVELQPSPPLFAAEKIPTPLLGRRVTKSCKVTKTADEYDAQLTGNRICEV